MKLFVRLCCLGLIVIGLLMAFLPTILSSDWGRNQTIHWINHSIPGTIEIKHLNFRWGGGQVIEGFTLRDPEGKIVLTIDQISTEAPFWKIFNRNLCLGETQVRELNALIENHENGQTNLERALGIDNDQVKTIVSSSKIILSHLNIHSHLSHSPLTAQIKGYTQQDDLEGFFDIDISLNALWAADWKNIKKNAQKYQNDERYKEDKIHVHVENFPIDLIDRLVALQNPKFNGLFSSLLGDRLNIHLEKEYNGEGITVSLKLLTPYLNGHLSGLIKNGLILVSDSSVFHLKLNPESINSWLIQPIQLIKPTDLEVVLSNSQIPFNFFSESSVDLDPCFLGLKIEFKLSETDLNLDDIGQFTIKNIQAHLMTAPCDKLVQIEVIGQAKHESEPFDLHFTSTFNKPSNFFQPLKKTLKQLHSTWTISKFPLHLIDIFNKHPEWNSILGSHANIQLDIHPQKEEEWIGTLSFQTPTIVLKKAQLNIGKEINLISPTKLQCSLTSNCFSNFFKEEKFLFKNTPTVEVAFNQFQFSFEKKKVTKVQVETFIPSIQLTQLMPQIDLQFNDLNLKIEGNNFSQFDTTLTGKFFVLNLDGSPSPFVPEPLEIHQVSHWKIGNDDIQMLYSSLDQSLNFDPAKTPGVTGRKLVHTSNINQLAIDQSRELSHGSTSNPDPRWSIKSQIELRNSMTHIQAKAQLNSDQFLELIDPVQIHYTFTHPILQSLSNFSNMRFPRIKDPVTLKLKIEPTEFNLKSFSLANLYLQGFIEIKQILFDDPSNTLPIIENVLVPWVIDSPMNNIYANLKGLAYYDKEKKPHQISSHLQFWLTPGHLDFIHFPSEIRMNWTGLPTALFNGIFGIHDLSHILGPVLDVKLNSFFEPKTQKSGFSFFVIDSKNFHMDGQFNLDKYATLFDSDKPASFRLDVTSENYPFLKKIFQFHDDRKLSTSFTLTANLIDLRIPLKESWADRTTFELNFGSTDIQWDHDLPFKIKGGVWSSNLLELVHFSLKTEGSPSLKLEGSLSNLFDERSRLKDFEEISLKSKLNAQQFHPEFLSQLSLINSDQMQKLQAFFGESFDLSFDFQLSKRSGSIQALVQGPLGQFHLDGLINNNILTLQKAIEGSVKLTPQFIQAFFGPNVPVLKSVIPAKNLIKVTVDPLHFSCPLFPFQLEKFNVGNGNLDLGKLQFRNEGELLTILKFIHPFSDPQVNIWFTPIYFQLENGLLSLKRFDMLIENAYTLANWGSIDLKTNKSQFVLGLDSHTLQKAFGVQGLNEKYILQIPFSSSKGKIEFDKKKLTARISSLLAQTHGGTKGKLLGTILDLALSEKGDPYPPPTTQPFPWHHEFHPEIQTPKELTSKDEDEDAQIQSKDNIKDKKKKRKLLDGEQIKNLQENALDFLDRWISPS